MAAIAASWVLDCNYGAAPHLLLVPRNTDPADYVVWRKTLGCTSYFRADGNGGNEVEADDYRWWAARFGTVLGRAGSGSAVGSAVPTPEPVSAVLASFALFAMISIEHRSRGREPSG